MIRRASLKPSHSFDGCVHPQDAPSSPSPLTPPLDNGVMTLGRLTYKDSVRISVMDKFTFEGPGGSTSSLTGQTRQALAQQGKQVGPAVLSVINQ